MTERDFNSVKDHHSFIPVITTDSASIISRSPESLHSPQVNLLSIKEPTAPAPKSLSFKQDQEKEEEQENTIIPLTQHQRHYTKQTILKQGLVLCTRTEEWYTKKKSTMREVQLRKTRLRWRQFKAVLRPNRIELYHVTTILITAQRLAHVIYLNNQYPCRRVKLSLISSEDYIWCLEFLHYETKSLISFHFQSTSISEAQDWYMSIYRILPPIISCKKPIPPFVDIFVVVQRQQQQEQILQEPLLIRIPLDMILNANDENDTQLNICTSDLKQVIWNLFKKNNLLKMLSINGEKTTMEEIRLCWRRVSAMNTHGEGAASTAKTTAISSTTPTLGNHIEWITENTELIGPQLIEQNHRLELRSSKPSSNQSTKTTKNISAITFDGLLIHKQWHTVHGKQRKCKKTWYYTILYGHHLFFMDKSYYYFYKRLREQQELQQRQGSNHINIETNKRNHNWFSATTGGIHIQLQKKKPNYRKKKQPWQNLNQSTPHLTPSSTAIDPTTTSSLKDAPRPRPPPDPFTLVNTKFVIDLHKVHHVQPMLQTGTQFSTSNTFEIHIKSDHEEGTILYYEAPNTQIMLEWVTLINSKLKIDPLLLVGHYSGLETYQSRPENVKHILQSGLLYVKKDYKRHFQSQYCILTKNEHGGGLMMFDMFKNKKQWWCHIDYSDDNNQQRQGLSVYEKKRQLIQLENTYVYSGDECILDKLTESKNNVEPYRYYKDGAVTGRNKTSECVFVIWQITKRHFVPNFREYLSLFKFGHRLGNRGSCWVFKARSRQERDEWLWALHKEFGLLKL